MAAITINAAQVGHIRERFEIVFAILRKLLDAFVSYRMKRTAAAAEQDSPTTVPGHAAAVTAQ